MFSDLQSAYQWLDQHVNHERNLGKITYDARAFELDEFRRLLSALDEPQRGRSSIHIAGTRGKGSVTLALEALLRAQGFRTAAYISPHLTEYRERIRIDGEPISPEGFRKHLAETARAQENCKHDSAGFRTVFEHLTAMFFLAAREHQADWMIVETGLGGRLDATNALDPGPVVLTRIGLEHTHLLGTTYEAIAGEKAAILKSGGWGIVGAQDAEHGAREVFEQRARDVNADLKSAAELCPVISREFSPQGMRLRFSFLEQPLDLDLPLLGPFLVENLQNALAMFGSLVQRGLVDQLKTESIAQALRGLKLPGRMELLAQLPGASQDADLRLIADSGHCPTGARAIAESMRAHFGSETACAVVGMAEEKDHMGFFRELAGWPGWRRIVVYRLDSPRAAEPQALFEAAKHNFSCVDKAKNLTEALEFANLASEKYTNVIVVGSAYSIAAATQWGAKYGR